MLALCYQGLDLARDAVVVRELHRRTLKRSRPVRLLASIERSERERRALIDLLHTAGIRVHKPDLYLKRDWT